MSLDNTKIAFSDEKNGIVDKKKLLSMRPPNLHKGISTSTNIVDIDDMIDKSGCSQVYYKLEECLGEHDRDWRKCQNEVKALQICNKSMPKR
jgi:hypothetical protein